MFVRSMFRLGVVSSRRIRVTSDQLICRSQPGFVISPPHSIRMIWNPFAEKKKEENIKILESKISEEKDDYQDASADEDFSEYDETEEEEEVFWESKSDLKEDVMDILKKMTRQVKFIPGLLGFSLKKNIVKEVIPNSQAEYAGLRVGWIVLDVNGERQSSDCSKIRQNIEKTHNNNKSTMILFQEEMASTAFENMQSKFRILDTCIEKFGIDIPSTDLGQLTSMDAFINYIWDRQQKIDKEIEEREFDKTDKLPSNLRIFG